ncbi:uncharacterized protein GGS22DRAFT_192395 [Annulohypoxylon maeteangense]|uniref:uncharacterized protein n=1 Tax=Annulohypoxylon maeteangense TaxID=1927788 RepID=UPI0020083B32|nr:uncharacterized protein GGS22DRAFT_192395 [Annulohypoxylon maeteangense]KAI0881307.1 hypothetical protein GGS22DRAFT_192395 [Annulohypoxylon maeteangense]
MQDDDAMHGIILSGDQGCVSTAPLPPSSYSPRCTLLSTPPEIRCMIYKHVFRGNLNKLLADYIENSKRLRPEHLEDHSETGPDSSDNYLEDRTALLPLLLVCKQVHDEVAAELYKQIKLEYDLDEWISALNKIGPRYGAMVQHVEYVHECWECHRRCDDNGTMWDCLIDTPNTHIRIFECLASNNVNPRHLKITSYSLLGLQGDDHVMKETIPDCTQHKHFEGQTYHDQTFINQMFSLCKNIRGIQFDGAFNPLWVATLRNKLDFIIRLENPFENVDASQPSGTWTLMDPKSNGFAKELRDYTPLDSNGQVYIKLPDRINYIRQRRGLINAGDDTTGDEICHVQYRERTPFPDEDSTEST